MGWTGWLSLDGAIYRAPMVLKMRHKKVAWGVVGTYHSVFREEETGGI